MDYSEFIHISKAKTLNSLKSVYFQLVNYNFSFKMFIDYKVYLNK